MVGLFWIVVGLGEFAFGGGWRLVYFEWCWVVVGLF